MSRYAELVSPGYMEIIIFLKTLDLFQTHDKIRSDFGYVKEQIMDISIFEQLASTVHHNVDLAALLEKEPEIVQQAFLNNDSSRLKSFLSNNQLLPDRKTIFQM